MSGHKKKKKKKKGFWIFLSIMLVVSVIAGNQAAALNHRIHGTLNLMTHDDSGVIANVDNELAGAVTALIIIYILINVCRKENN